MPFKALWSIYNDYIKSIIRLYILGARPRLAVSFSELEKVWGLVIVEIRIASR
jgi:hypothetical protein